jgi:hypothetical protein
MNTKTNNGASPSEVPLTERDHQLALAMAEHLGHRESLPKTRYEMAEALEGASFKLRKAYRRGEIIWSMVKHLLREQRRPSAVASPESVTSGVTRPEEEPISEMVESPVEADK